MDRGPRPAHARCITGTLENGGFPHGLVVSVRGRTRPIVASHLPTSPPTSLQNRFSCSPSPPSITALVQVSSSATPRGKTFREGLGYAERCPSSIGRAAAAKPWRAYNSPQPMWPRYYSTTRPRAADASKKRKEIQGRGITLRTSSSRRPRTRAPRPTSREGEPSLAASAKKEPGYPLAQAPLLAANEAGAEKCTAWGYTSPSSR